MNTCEQQMATMTPEQIALAGKFYSDDTPDGDLMDLIRRNSIVAAYYLRCGVLGYEPEDGE